MLAFLRSIIPTTVRCSSCDLLVAMETVAAWRHKTREQIDAVLTRNKRHNITFSATDKSFNVLEIITVLPGNKFMYNNEDKSQELPIKTSERYVGGFLTIFRYLSLSPNNTLLMSNLCRNISLFVGPIIYFNDCLFLYLCIIYLTTLSLAQIKRASNDNMNNEERNDSGLSQGLSRHLSGGTEENHDKPQSC
jgi:hypothetical protein